MKEIKIRQEHVHKLKTSVHGRKNSLKCVHRTGFIDRELTECDHVFNGLPTGLKIDIFGVAAELADHRVNLFGKVGIGLDDDLDQFAGVNERGVRLAKGLGDFRKR